MYVQKIHENFIKGVNFSLLSERKAQMEIIKDKLWEKKNIEVGQEEYRNDMLFGAYGIQVVLNMTRLIKEYMIEQVCNSPYYFS